MNALTSIQPAPPTAKPFKYAGIGSRNTPEDVLGMMRTVANQLAPSWLLRSGYADGADNAFWVGAHFTTPIPGDYEMILPWAGFNHAPLHDDRFIVPAFDERWWDLAAKFHPNWNACTIGAKKMHARNIAQILGRNALDTPDPVDMVICWTPKGADGGGTGQAIRIAEHLHIPVFDLAIESHKDDLISFVAAKESGMP